MKTRMIISLSRYGISILYKCYNGTLKYGRKCPNRDNGNYCMKCKYCKAEMSAYDATKLINSFRTKNNENI